jgi:hypothetical protein
MSAAEQNQLLFRINIDPGALLRRPCPLPPVPCPLA